MRIGARSLFQRGIGVIRRVQGHLALLERSLHVFLRYIFPAATFVFLAITIMKARGANEPDAWQTVLTSCTYIAIVVTGGLGVISAVTDTKKHGKMTRWGWTALVVGLTGFVIAVASQ